ncbi:MAG: HAD hydrolase family protein [Firmicutes bacterium]|nr:HAD hydrolase family protein [Bacillota bacterium]
MYIKAIITDLDRTLLHTDKSVSEHTIAVLQKCHDHGILIMAASARPLRDILPYNDLIGFDAITATNGAVVSLPQNLLEIGIPCESGEKILSAILQYPDVFLSIETSKGLYSNRDIPVWEPVIWDKFPTLPENIILYKILASSQQKPLYEGIKTVLTDDVYHTIANNDLIQIMCNEATKWNGIKQMLSHFGVSPSEAVYFGDDNDDIESIKNCGLGVAVSNAIPSVLDVADHITESNDQDGVAKCLEKIILS